MRVVKVVSSLQRGPFVELHGDDGTPVVAVSGFLRHLGARGYSPNTLAAYAYDLLHFWRFLALERLTYAEFRPPHALELLAYLRQVPTRQPAQRLGLGLCTVDAHEAAGRAAGLLRPDGSPAVSAHRFRHTVGTALGNKGARLHTIMKVLGHTSPSMAMVYTSISDPEVLRDYRAVLGPGATLAGPLAAALRAGDLPASTVEWLKSSFFKTELELGHCLRLPEEGPCECDLALTCAKFVTTRAYAPRLRRRRHGSSSWPRTRRPADGSARWSATAARPSASSGTWRTSLNRLRGPWRQSELASRARCGSARAR